MTLGKEKGKQRVAWRLKPSPPRAQPLCETQISWPSQRTANRASQPLQIHKARLQSVFNWPATRAVYAAIARKVKTKSAIKQSVFAAFDWPRANAITVLLDSKSRVAVPVTHEPRARTSQPRCAPHRRGLLSGCHFHARKRREVCSPLRAFSPTRP